MATMNYNGQDIERIRLLQDAQGYTAGTLFYRYDEGWQHDPDVDTPFNDTQATNALDASIAEVVLELVGVFPFGRLRRHKRFPRRRVLYIDITGGTANQFINLVLKDEVTNPRAIRFNVPGGGASTNAVLVVQLDFDENGGFIVPQWMITYASEILRQVYVWQAREFFSENPEWGADINDTTQEIDFSGDDITIRDLKQLYVEARNR